jgi:16S rRNA (cytosine967-C5)-methyltransferase
VSTKVSPARESASDILLRIEREDAFASSLLASPRYDRLSPEDRGLLQELVLGVLRWRGQLDFLIERYARRTLAKLDREVIVALRLGLYQLKFLSRIPAHAAINESVNLTKRLGKKSAAPFVNALLRSAEREKAVDIASAGLAIETSHPAWLLDRWIGRYGEGEARSLAMANNETPRAAFRFTRGETHLPGIECRPSTIAHEAFVIESGSLSPQSAPIRDGRIYLQDEASQLVARISAHNLKSQISNFKFFDACAAPGSKTTLAASLLPKGSLIVAGDLHAHRLRIMQELIERQSAAGISLLALDAKNELPFNSQFDAILLDAPCSGLGTLARNPELKWRMSEAKISELAVLQKFLLENVSQYLRPGGLLTYSACSTEPEEGEDIIAAFRAAHPEYRDMTRERLVELGIAPEPLLTSGFGARTFPHLHKTEGFFFCTLWKRT